MVAFHERFALVMHGHVSGRRFIPAKVDTILIGSILMKLPKIATNAIFWDCPGDLPLKSAAGTSR